MAFTPSFNRLSRASRLALSVAALGLGGCTITMYGNERPPPRPPPPARAHRSGTPQRPTAPPATAQRPAPKPPQTPPPSREDPDVTPRIKSPIVFGRSVQSAFAGHAYVIPETSKSLPNLSALVPFARLWADSFDIQTQEFSSGFPGALAQDAWFAIRYEGRFELPKDGDWTFKLGSDDGAVLWIDGQKVVDNDGLHDYKEATGKAQLKAGPHRLRLEYFQAKQGTVALRLWVVDQGRDTILAGVR